MFRSSANAEWAWYVIQCKPRQEMRALEHLTRQSFETYCPIIPSRKATGAQASSQPLFPGYLFVYLAAETNWSSLRATRGVARVVAFNGQPCPVSDELIAGIRQRCAASIQASLTPYTYGAQENRPCPDMDALFKVADGTQRVVLLMNMLAHPSAVMAPIMSLSA
ncbi:transcriptional activator RfaH [Pseudomonas sp. Marseille-QA0892]